MENKGGYVFSSFSAIVIIIVLIFIIGALTNVNKYKRPAEVPSLLGDSRKARKKLGWKPKVNFQELCKMMLESDLNKFGLNIDEAKKKFSKSKKK